MKKFIAIVFACLSLIVLTTCTKQDKSAVNVTKFKQLAGNDFNAVGSLITAYGLDFDFSEYEGNGHYGLYTAGTAKSSKGTLGVASVVQLNIPMVINENQTESAFTAYAPTCVDAILAQAFKKDEVENRFIVVNGGRYFPHLLEKYIIYEDEEVVVYNLMPIIINEEYELYLNSQKPFDITPDYTQTYYHWSEYLDDLTNASEHIKVVKAG